MKKYKWSTYKIVKETEDTITIYFDTAQQTFNYLPGQYLNIKCVINEELVIRSYSLSSKPSDEFPSITVKRVAGGKMSNHLVDNAIFISSWEIEAPFGNFVLEKQVAAHAQIVLLTGGSGISPLFSMLKSIDKSAKTPLLIYGNKSPEETIFWNELEVMQADGKLNPYYSFTSDEFVSSKINHITGRFSPQLLHSIIRKQVATLEEANYYICGPVGLMKLYQEALLGLNISPEQIHTEYFDPVPEENLVFENDGISKDVIVTYFQDHYINNEVQTYECTSLIEVKANQSLLDAMNEHHIKVSSSCKNGTCGTCWALKTDGEVRMLNHHALTEQNISEGIILLCQSYPMDEEVVINLS
ncbi:iron-sulfur cluster-binding domain-containing protein [Chryseobacterium aahli]|uniref:iron-sulfur cluster-binding domain-containing protein n=1 Tax=Chryseobacterium aahli TaxID=1278643 RepID=UPI001F61E72B|nr:iron-sulfur cluster-binding domain-containing protein [Chryseobacterium aahli]MCI3937209.1 iron-sulfur cluster-binding domain-containing protein [Chryseobacterium aahli]